MHLGFCSCHATICCTLLCFSAIEILVLCNPWHHMIYFFLPSRISILNMVYICYFSPPICDFWLYSSTLSLHSNSIGLIQFGFFKRELCTISQNDLFMDFFIRENLSGMPCVTVYSFGFEIGTSKTKVCALPSTFYIIPIWYSERVSWKFSQGHFFEMNFWSLQKP